MIYNKKIIVSNKYIIINLSFITNMMPLSCFINKQVISGNSSPHKYWKMAVQVVSLFFLCVKYELPDTSNY